MITTTTVLSKDGAHFTVQFFARNEAHARATEIVEARFAATRLAAELDSFAPDYQRVIKSMDDLVGMDFVFDPTKPTRPIEVNLPAQYGGPRRLHSKPVLTLIQGGKS